MDLLGPIYGKHKGTYLLLEYLQFLFNITNFPIISL